VQHHIALSIVGADRIPGIGCYRAKVAQENLIKSATVPYTVVRATQSFEFVAKLTDDNTQADTVACRPFPCSPSRQMMLSQRSPVQP
jgi:uncharacterized protein YbjT (DUF2867 family)